MNIEVEAMQIDVLENEVKCSCFICKTVVMIPITTRNAMDKALRKFLYKHEKCAQGKAN